MINLITIGSLCQFSEVKNDPFGFGRLCLKDMNDLTLGTYIEPITRCLSSEKIRKRFYQLLTSARSRVIRKESMDLFKNLKMLWSSGDKRCGTAIHAD
ncbi:unnamed protein product [Didymodactylos carnosus]|uniref:Uncharacterized protein n=2 Tax=Didymodactylos carnosus TaxID=1234261 RepID=A0A813S3D1_9BILA|nr:unnamed protein product [Didymodactylos carnosus]CAF3574410.1 unnamed protein product [Didymodactylos carnosus]